MIRRLLCCILFTYSLHAQVQPFFIDSLHVPGLHKSLDSSLIVGLGEAGHGFESFNSTKSVLVDMLREEWKCEAIVFESSFNESVIGFLSDSTLQTRTQRFLYPFWNTYSVKRSLQPFFDLEKRKNIPCILGFDIQEDCRFIQLSQLLVDQKLISVNQKNLFICDSILSCFIGKNASCTTAVPQHTYDLLIKNYEMITAELSSRPLDELQNKLLVRCMENRMWLCKYLTLTTTNEKMYYRDSLMAANIIWLQKEIYPASRFIIWTTNLHITQHENNHLRSPKWTGEWLSFAYQEKYYTIAFEKGKAHESFVWKNNIYKYSNSSKKYDLVIHLDPLIKIRPEEWITPCD